MHILIFTTTILLAAITSATSPIWSTYEPSIPSKVDPTLQEFPGEAPTLPLPALLRREDKIGPQWGGHFACHDANFTGACNYYVEKRGACHEYEKENWNKYTSIGPDKGQWCYFYEGEQCLGDHVELRHPGSTNLRGKRFDNRVRSWNCWKNE